MSGVAESLGTRDGSDQPLLRPLGVFAPWRLYAFGCVVTAIWAIGLLNLYQRGHWLADNLGVPVYTDFACAYVAGLHALQGDTASLYIPKEFLKAQDALVGPGHSVFWTWPYPPTFLLILAPLATLPYITAFLTWDLVTLVGCIAVVYLIVRRQPAITLVLASPFTAWNFFSGQMGFFTASLIGASLLLLERRPMLAGAFIGALTYKPHFGILLPVALVAAKQWRALATATATALLLVVASIAMFGTAVWEAFPSGLTAQANVNLFANPDLHWGYLQTLYGLIRSIGGDANVAWFGQSVTTLGSGVVVWLVWRSPVRYSLKAATLSAAALIATPYGYAYDMAAIAIPVAFLARDQIHRGSLRGEQALLLALFGVGLVCNTGRIPLGPVVVITLLGVILRRTLEGKSPGPLWSRGIAAVLKKRAKFFETTPSVSN